MKTRTQSLVMVAAVLGFGTLAFLSRTGVASVTERSSSVVWTGERGVPQVSDVNAGRIADLTPSLLTQARW